MIAVIQSWLSDPGLEVLVSESCGSVFSCRLTVLAMREIAGGSGWFHEGRTSRQRQVNVDSWRFHEGRGAGKTDP
jgi:hypothetical protein